MPLYMDFHIIPHVTIEEVKNAHIADQAVQDKYDVKYHQFWVNEAAGTVFCLMEGPDKESCAATHREAHGNIACEIVEVEQGLYHLFMGEKNQTDQGLVLHEDGTVDTGYRFVLAINIIGNTHITTSLDYKRLRIPDKPKRYAIDKIAEFQGKQVRHLGDDCIIAAFKDPEYALDCAVEIKNGLREKTNDPKVPEWDVVFQMGIGGSTPLNEKNGFFEEAVKLGKRLSLIAKNQEIIIAPIVEQLCNSDSIARFRQSVRAISTSEEKFLDSLFDITETKLSNDLFNVQRLGKDIGLSRPQLYRKVQSITGRTPNGFIRDLKMHKALLLLHEQQMNVSEIALEVGYNNASYFAKCFQEKYGIAPSKVES